MCKIVSIFLAISFDMCFGCSKELSHRDSSFEYPQHMFWLRDKENNVHLCTLIWRPDIYVGLIMRNHVFGVSDLVRPNHHAQLQRLAKSVQFRLLQVQLLYLSESEEQSLHATKSDFLALRLILKGHKNWRYQTLLYFSENY